MHYCFPYYDDPPAPQEPPQTYTPLSPPRSRHNLPSSSRPTPHNAPTDSQPHPHTRATSPPGETDSRNKSRARASSPSRSPGSEPSFQVRSNDANANLSPPNPLPCPGPSSVNLGRRRTLSAASASGRRDSVDVDARSIISSLLDAYCRSDATDDAWDDAASGTFSDEVSSLASSSVCNYRCRRESNSTIVASEFPTRRPKCPSLLVGPSPRWDPLDSALLAAPVAKNTRPLPPLPAPCTSQCHNARPLPHLPFQPPPYTPPVGINSASTSDIRPVPSLSFPRSSARTSSTSSSSSTSRASVPSSSGSTASLGLGCALDQPMLSKYRSLPLLTIPSSPSSHQPSPLPSYIPVPPSPTTARRHQASKLSRMLGEDISPEFLGPNRVSRFPPSSIVTARTVNQRQTSKTKNDSFSLPTVRRMQSRAVRPNAIYVHDDTSEESNVGGEKMSFLDFTDDEESIVRQDGIKIDLSIEESDDTASSDASEVLSPSDSVSEEMEDMEEARIGWALQNVITYQKAARVKRTSRMWVLEKNGQRWEEQDHMNVRQALRQL